MFVPSNDFLSSNFSTFKSHFGFVDTISNSVEQFKNFNDDTATPYVDIDLNTHLNIAGKDVVLGGKAHIIDLRFYAPYKATGDLMVTAFVYILFLWRVFSRLPEIISGAGIMESTSGKIERYRTRGDK